MLHWPGSPADIAKIQSARKRRAVAQAMRAPFFRDRLKGIDLDRLDDPEVWSKIPLLTKDQLRQVPAERFETEFCVAPRSAIVEYWRSGGVTGRPLFYPRSADDMEYSIACFRRAFVVVGATATTWSTSRSRSASIRWRISMRAPRKTWASARSGAAPAATRRR